MEITVKIVFENHAQVYLTKQEVIALRDQLNEMYPTATTAKDKVETFMRESTMPSTYSQYGGLSKSNEKVCMDRARDYSTDTRPYSV